MPVAPMVRRDRNRFVEASNRFSGVGLDHANAGPRLVPLRIYFQCSLKVSNSVVMTAEVVESPADIGPRAGIVGRVRKHVLKYGERFVHPAREHELFCASSKTDHRRCSSRLAFDNPAE